MDEAAKNYIQALNVRRTTRRRPPHDVFDLQDKVKAYVKQLKNAREKLHTATELRRPRRVSRAAIAKYGIYAIGNRLLARRGANTNSAHHGSLGFWNINRDASVYLKRDGRDWVIVYGDDDGKMVQLDEHWTGTSTGLR